MPHICTRCSNVFDSGEDILKGCPNCGSKKFMFVKKKPLDCKEQMRQSEQIITRAMGVRVPPRMREKEPVAIEAKEEMMQAMQESFSVAPLPPTLHIPSKKKLDEEHQSQEKTLESVKITAPGTYELNLPSLFERDELIMAVKEGTYFIDLASVFKKSKKD
ncbi:MAG: Zn-ribbon domain-containing protein [Methanothrix sp.]|nr:Zn-ribbon domain-containing protein [Methanothrix sp.]MDD4447257.1 Zn-ribbon domain-containing protein [Methanothrix sp.]